VRERLGIPIIANGDIWTLDGFRRCRAETGCEHFMLGRGALANPLLAVQVAHELGLRSGPLPAHWEWPALLLRLINWTKHFHEVNHERALSRLKQWLSMAAKFGSFTGFDRIKRAQSCEEVLMLLT
jgi:tRNA-dihydrouridine synthase C